MDTLKKILLTILGIFAVGIGAIFFLAGMFTTWLFM